MIWHMVGPRSDKIITVAIFIYLTPLFSYQFANIALRPFAYAATTQYDIDLGLNWLRVPCDDRWIGYKTSYRSGADRAHIMLCLTADGWVVIPTDNDPSTPSRPSVTHLGQTDRPSPR